MFLDLFTACLVAALSAAGALALLHRWAGKNPHRAAAVLFVLTPLVPGAVGWIWLGNSAAVTPFLAWAGVLAGADAWELRRESIEPDRLTLIRWGLASALGVVCAAAWWGLRAS